MKKLIALLTAVFLLLPGCGVQKTPDTGYTKYSAQFYGTFDTVVQIVGYCKTEEEFSRYAGQIKSRMEELSQLYDIYYEYSDENNLKLSMIMLESSLFRYEKKYLILSNFAKSGMEKPMEK